MSHPSRDSGLTLIEVLTAMAILGALMAVAVGGWSAWTNASAHSGTAREIQSAMRQAQQQAITEGTATCVLFDEAAETYAVYRGGCSDSTKQKVAGPVTAANGIDIDDPSFIATSGSSPGVTFQGRGTATPGDVRIGRNGSGTTYQLAVDWLTGRVSLS
jgi:prepilin-type N-terminal cleavage/methylation domain-containing protein